MKRIGWLLTGLLLLPLAVRAQTPAADAWQVVVYEDGAQAAKVLTADGVTLSIPTGSLALHMGTFPSVPLVALSDDRHALASVSLTPFLSVGIAAQGTCCKTVRLADQAAALAEIGGFSPNGRRFVVSYLVATSDTTFDSAVVTVDVEQGAVVAQLDQNQIGGDFAWLRGWNADGIDFVALCYNCNQPPAGSVSRWNPDTGAVTTGVGYASAAQDVLAATGEYVAPSRRPDYPLPIGDTSTTPNVVAYGDGSDLRVAYYNPNSLQVSGAHWVADGWMVLVERPDGQAELLDRSGVARPAPGGEQFLVGTPDGWLATRAVPQGWIDVVYHTLTDVEGKVIAHVYHPLTVLQAPPLGATATRGGFPEVPSPVSRITCPNALPPRLISGGKGRIITPMGVNLRREPSADSPSIFLITGSQVFDVIGGPNCDPTGIAWWEVAFGGLHGWMAESRNGVYLLEPVLN